MIKKNVTIISPSFLPVPATKGGAIESTIQLLIEQNEIFNELNITVVSSYDQEAYNLSRQYVNTNFIWIHRGKLYNFINFFYRIRKYIFKDVDHYDSEQIKKILRKDRNQKVIVHGNTTFLSIVSKVFSKENIYFYVHANIFNEKNSTNISLAKLPKKILCVSNFIKEKIIQNTEAPENVVEVIRNPINYEMFYKCRESPDTTLLKKLNILPNEVVILFVGRIVENKGIVELLEAVSKVKSKQPFKLLVVGSFGSNFGLSSDNDNFKNEVLKIANDLGDKIRFSGFVPNNELPSYHSISHIVVMPSKVAEAAGKVAMEAMTSGIPVITTTSGGIKEYVSQEAGFFVECNEFMVDNLKVALENLIDDPNLRNEMGASGEKWAQDFKPSRFYYDYVNMLEF